MATIDLLNASYINAIDANFTIHFQLFPRSVSDGKQANWNDQEIIGRSHPIKGYSSSGSRTLSFSLEFFAALHQSDAIRDVQGECDKLQSLQYPEYGALIFPPSRVYAKVGSLSIYGICSQCDIEYPDNGPWEVTGSYKPMYATASLTFEEVSDSPLSASERRDGAIAGPGGSSTGAFS